MVKKDVSCIVSQKIRPIYSATLSKRNRHPVFLDTVYAMQSQRQNEKLPHLIKTIMFVTVDRRPKNAVNTGEWE